MFQSNGLLKFTEQDIWSDGCQPDTATSYMIDYRFTGKTADEVIQKIAEFTNSGKDGIERNACDEPGRVDFCVTENADGNPLSKMEWAQFKKGKIKAYYAVYTAYIEQTTPAKL
jgi:hypothetical protein